MKAIFCKSLTASKKYAVVILTVMTVSVLSWNGMHDSPSIDECGHLAAGLSHCQTGRFDLYKVNPPLTRTSALLIPSCFAACRVPYQPRPTESRREFELGKWLIRVAPAHSLHQVMAGRFFCVAMFPFLLLTVRSLLRESQLDACFTTAALLLLFSPLTGASASMITPDFTAAVFGFIAIAQFRTWLASGDLMQTLRLGVAVSAALLTKFTWFVILPVAIIGIWLSRAVMWRLCLRQVILDVRAFAFVSAFTLLAINAFYQFNDSLKPVGEIECVSRLFAGSDENRLNRRNVLFGTCVHYFPSPLPPLYIQGIDLQRRDFEVGYRSYLMGEWKHGGWWYYYLVGFLVKEPIGFQLMLYVSILHGLWNWRR
ncbi:MAG: hypothetical protein KDA96_21290, partial [Planctomycetaceae bacterium]|nr:hypothetical protein [Planctomycetaceae bacterium]